MVEKARAEKNRKESLTLLLAILLIALVLEVVAGICIFYAFDKDWAKAGNFGETFGVVNTLFAGWAFAGAIYTLWLQKKALEEQRLQFQKHDEESDETKAARLKTHQRMDRQIEALNRAVEIQAIQVGLQYLTEKLIIDPNNKEFVDKKKSYIQKLDGLLGIEKL